jgi:gamma-glutamylcyclotransferase (GGCT)/AIG2-like uncharacterized protein YtfP
VSGSGNQAGEPEWLFVYVTVRLRIPRHTILQRLGAQSRGKGSTRAELVGLGRYPDARPSEHPCAFLVGELYRLRQHGQALRVLDEVEDFRPTHPASSLFRRANVTVRRQNGEQVSAWVYWLNRRHAPERPFAFGDYARKERRIKFEG